MNGIPVALRLEKLPHCAHLHELRGFVLQLFYFLIEFECLRITLMQQLLKVAFEAQMTAIEHVRIDVAPDLRQIRQLPYLAVKVWNGRDRNVSADLAAADICEHTSGFRTRSEDCRSVLEAVRGEHLLAQLGIHDLVHETQARHCVLGIKSWRLVAGRN